MRLAIVPARGGSKRIPRKNVRDFLGQPILKYSIDAALGSGSFDEVMVSTDDAEIAAIARRCGAEVPFLRSAVASSDHAGTEDVVREVLAEYRARGRTVDRFSCIYPTAPFLTAARIREAARLLDERGADAVITVARFRNPVWRSLRLEDGRLCMNWPEYVDSRSQDLPVAYYDAGQLYCARADRFLETGTLFPPFTVPLELPDSEVQDIDTEEDWLLAEEKYRRLRVSQ